MIKQVLLAIVTIGISTAFGLADELSFNSEILIENDPDLRVPDKALPQLDVPMQPYYEEFAADGLIEVVMAIGAESLSLNQAMEYSRDHLESFNVSDVVEENRQLRFINLDTGNRYKIDFVDTREGWVRALAEAEVVAYFGHSRYGRGPTFETMTNYFRMGGRFSDVEVDTRNPHFSRESFQQTGTYPVLTTRYNGEILRYQYRGGRLEGHGLPQESFTKLIKGKDADLRQAEFLNRKQIFILYSCVNYYYWAESLRNRFPDPNEKLFFGTYGNAVQQIPAVFTVIRRLLEKPERSPEFARDLNRGSLCLDTSSSGSCYVAF